MMIQLQALNRTAEIAVLCASFADRIHIDQALAEERLRDFEIYGLYAPELCGAFVAKDNEVHVCVLPEYRGKWFSRRLFRDMTDERMRKYGRIRTKAIFDDLESNLFIRRLGFLPTLICGAEQHYEMAADVLTASRTLQ
jgi:GNAT superfamily N-acetyltransferase